MRRAVIVGSSVGGVRTAQALRRAGYPGEVVLLGAEPDLPYDKPPLSKNVLSGAASPESIRLFTEQDAAKAEVELRLGHTAQRLDVEANEVCLADDTRLGYDEVVVATGSSPNPSPWGQPAGVHLLRTQDDCAALREDLLAGGHLVVVGAGFIGCEIAATARGLGLEVSLVDTLRAPMSRVLGDDVGALFRAFPEDNGVHTRFGVAVHGIDGKRGALRVRLSDGEELLAAAVVVGIGASPNDEWLADSGLSVQDGLVCDEHCRALGAGNVYAVGDVLRWWHPGRQQRMRIEHWTGAVESATVVAHNITHPDQPREYRPVQYVWSDQYDRKIQVVGQTGAGTHELYGDPAQGRFAALFRHEDAAAGMVAVDWPKAMLTTRKALNSGTPLTQLREQLAELG